jgi:hypothetical protein
MTKGNPRKGYKKWRRGLLSRSVLNPKGMRRRIVEGACHGESKVGGYVSGG